MSRDKDSDFLNNKTLIILASLSSFYINLCKSHSWAALTNRFILSLSRFFLAQQKESVPIHTKIHANIGTDIHSYKYIQLALDINKHI